MLTFSEIGGNFENTKAIAGPSYLLVCLLIKKMFLCCLSFLFHWKTGIFDMIWP